MNYFLLKVNFKDIFNKIMDIKKNKLNKTLNMNFQ